MQRLEKEKREENADKQDMYTQPLYLLNFFEEFADVNGLDFQFAIIRESAFISNRRKIEENPIYIVLNEEEKTTFMDVMYGKEKSVNTGEAMLDTQLFYVYTSKRNLERAGKKKQKVADLLIEYI